MDVIKPYKSLSREVERPKKSGLYKFLRRRLLKEIEDIMGEYMGQYSEILELQKKLKEPGYKEKAREILKGIPGYKKKLGQIKTKSDDTIRLFHNWQKVGVRSSLIEIEEQLGYWDGQLDEIRKGLENQLLQPKNRPIDFKEYLDARLHIEIVSTFHCNSLFYWCLLNNPDEQSIKMRCMRELQQDKVDKIDAYRERQCKVLENWEKAEATEREAIEKECGFTRFGAAKDQPSQRGFSTPIITPSTSNRRPSGCERVNVRKMIAQWNNRSVQKQQKAKVKKVS